MYKTKDNETFIKKLRESKDYTDTLNWEKINDLMEAFLSFMEWYNDFCAEEFDRRVEFNYNKLTHIIDEENRHSHAIMITIKNIIRYYFPREEELIDAIESWSRSNFNRPYYINLLKTLIDPLFDKKESDEEEKEYQKRVALGSSDKYDSRWNESYKNKKSKIGLVENVENLTRKEEQFLVTRIAYDHDEIYEDIMQGRAEPGDDWYKTMEMALRKFLIKEAKKGFDIEHEYDFEEKLENLTKKDY